MSGVSRALIVLRIFMLTGIVVGDLKSRTFKDKGVGVEHFWTDCVSVLSVLFNYTLNPSSYYRCVILDKLIQYNCNSFIVY